MKVITATLTSRWSQTHCAWRTDLPNRMTLSLPSLLVARHLRSQCCGLACSRKDLCAGGRVLGSREDHLESCSWKKILENKMDLIRGEEIIWLYDIFDHQLYIFILLFDFKYFIITIDVYF